VRRLLLCEMSYKNVSIKSKAVTPFRSMFVDNQISILRMAISSESWQRTSKGFSEMKKAADRSGASWRRAIRRNATIGLIGSSGNGIPQCALVFDGTEMARILDFARIYSTRTYSKSPTTPSDLD